jgi:hypothetical protein
LGHTKGSYYVIPFHSIYCKKQVFYQALDDLVIYQAQKHVVVQYLKTHIVWWIKGYLCLFWRTNQHIFAQYILQMLCAVACILRNVQ